MVYNFDKICRSCLSESNQLISVLDPNPNNVNNVIGEQVSSGVATRASTAGIKKEDVSIVEQVMACTQVKVRYRMSSFPIRMKGV